MKNRFAFGLLTFLLGGGVAWMVVTASVPGTWASRTRETLFGTAAPVTASDEPQPAAKERVVKYWRAPMDPTYIRDQPGKSPMGMDLVPVYEDEVDVTPEGTVRIDPVFAQNMGVRSQPVVRADIPFTIRTIGTFAYNDRQVSFITTKYDGWIDKVYVNYVGEPVRKGQDLFDIYSPQLVTTEQEYLQAIQYAKRLAGSAYPDAAARAQSLVDAARQRLRYWDISDAQIDALAESGQVQRTLRVVSPVDGVVVEKMNQALEGMRATPGMQLYKIVDLSTIWVDVQVFEHQIAWLKPGLRAEIELPYAPGRYSGVVRFLHPSVDQKTRTVTASIELENPGRTLRADMYANVTIDVPSVQGVLAVPDSAVIHSGERDVVIVDLGHGLFEARDVNLGVSGNGLWQVTRGLDEGDLVVVSAQFLIDSESNLRQAIARISGAATGR